MIAKPILFCDFDGTIASRDVGYNMFRHFSGGRNDALIPGWKSGELSSRDCLRLEAEMVTCTGPEFYEYLDRFTLTEGFAEFEVQPIKIATDPERARKTFRNALRLLESGMPESSPRCEYCGWLSHFLLAGK